MDSIEEDDRCRFTPKHVGPNVLPNFLLFSRLVRLAHKKDLVAVRDLTFQYEATYLQLLTDVLHFRNVLWDTLDSSIKAKLNCDKEVFINLLGPGGYEFTVAFLAIMALGAVIVPISPDLPVKEATYFATKSRAIGVVTANNCLALAKKLQSALENSSNHGFLCIEIASQLMKKPLKVDQLIVSSDSYLDLNKSGLVIFTSGTTGPPKGGVRRRGFFVDVATMFADQCGLRERDVVLHVLPVHHATGITVTLLPFLWCGGTIEFRSGGFEVAWTWEHIRQGHLDFFSGVPTIYMRLMQHFEQNLSKKKEKTVQEYVKGARRIRAMLCGTSALPRPLQHKWMSLRDGAPVLTRYGGTEFGNAFTVTPWAESVPDGAVGFKTPGVDVKLSPDPEGEVLIRSPVMFSKYLFDNEATKNALDDAGYYKTGDIARREGDYYFILGRASIDIIKSGGYKISALDIEREILGLDYISEVMVVGVEDEEFGQRVAAAIILKSDSKQTLTVDELRKDLKESLAGYKMPTLLRVVDELKKNATGKVMKKTLVKELFPPMGHRDVQKWTPSNRESKL